MEKIKKMLVYFNTENLLYLFIIICPILDILSFLFRKYTGLTISPTTIIRPIIPTVVFIILFFKEKNKKSKILVGLIYFIYSIIHLIIFESLRNESSYGNLINELQYIINYSFLIINVYLFKHKFKDEIKLKKVVFIVLTIYILSIFVAIVTKTSYTTYLEGIGYKGWFESANSLCTTLLLSVLIILPDLKIKNIGRIVIIVITGGYLIFLSGMRTGLIGFCLVIAVFILGKIFIALKNKIKISKKKIILVTILIIVSMIGVLYGGSQTIERRKELKEFEINNIDEETGEKRYVSLDILNIYKKIQTGELADNYMTESEKAAIKDLCEFAERHNISNVDLRMQQFIYNIYLVKEQKNISYILFGNGYKNQTGELVMEMEVPAFLCNFGLIGFILYFGPFLAIFIYSLYKGIKNIKYITLDYIMYFAGAGLAIALSTLSGYVYFNFSSMLLTIIINILLLEKAKNIKPIGEVVNK